MKTSESLVFPSSFGYQFEPLPLDDPFFILQHLNQPGSYDESLRLRPFLKVTWYGNTLIKKGLIYIAGLTTHGIDNSIHRGSITVWCAVTMQTFEKRLRPSTQDIQNNLDKTCSHFKYGVSNPSFCPKFYEAFQINVEDYTSLREISNALDELTKESRNPEYTESINNLTILINKVKKFLTGACT